jgi:hypothetical protein
MNCIYVTLIKKIKKTNSSPFFPRKVMINDKLDMVFDMLKNSLNQRWKKKNF